MITELAYIQYFENLARLSKDFNHQDSDRRAFFYVPATWDLTEIDNVLNSPHKSAPMLLLDSIAGQLDDEQSENHVQVINGQITVLCQSKNGDAATIRAARDSALQIGLNTLARMKYDCRKHVLLHPSSRFTINHVLFDPVGPIAAIYYGYTFRFKIYCPFGYAVSSATWRDII